MKLLLRRLKNNGDTTIGSLFVDGKFQCYTLEDEPRKIKVHGETRIPSGTYNIQFRKEGGFHERYKERFPVFHVGMLQIMDVPGFEYILIHCGNTDEDTNGCILVGANVMEWELLKSALAYEDLYKQVAAALLNFEKVEIKIMDEE